MNWWKSTSPFAILIESFHLLWERFAFFCRGRSCCKFLLNFFLHLVKRKGEASIWWKEKASTSFMVFNSHHSDFSSLSCHSWLKPLVEDKSRAEQKDWLRPQKLLWVEKLSPHFPILSLPWLTWEAARFERTSRWFRTPWFEGIKSVFKVSRLPWSGWLVQCCWTGSFSLVQLPFGDV